MGDLPNTLRDRFDKDKDKDKENTPASMKERLGRGMGVPAASAKSDYLRLALVGGLLLLVVCGLVVVKMYETRGGTPSDPKARPGAPKIEVTADDDLRWDGTHKQFKDGSDPIDVNSKPFVSMYDHMTRHYTKEKVKELTNADREKLLKRIGESKKDDAQYPEATWRKAMWDYPDVARGKFFRVSGQLVEIYYEKISTGTSDVKEAWMGIMRDAQTGKPVHFYIAETPRPSGGGAFPTKVITERETTYRVLDNVWCEIEGVFLKLRPYESLRPMSRGGYQQREAAVLFAGSFRELPPPPIPPDVGRYVAIGVAIMGTIVGVVIFVGVMIARKMNKSGDMRMKLALARMQRDKAREAGADWKSIQE